MNIAIGQMYKDAYPVNGRIRRFVVTSCDRWTSKLGYAVEVAVLEPRKRKPSKFICFLAHRFGRRHARGLVRVK